MDFTGTINPFSTPLDVPEGGTGATTVAGALVNLQVPMGTVEGVNAGAGLTGGGNVGIVELAVASPLPVNLGGTGALNATQARTNLGAVGLASPGFTGVPTAPTATAGTTTTQLATTAFVMAAVGGAGGGTITGVTAGNGLAGGGTTGTVTLSLADPLILDAGTY